MKLFDYVGIDVGYVVLGLIGFCLILFILLLITMSKNRKLREKYDVFMSGEDAATLERSFLDKVSRMVALETNVEDIYQKINAIQSQLITAYQKVGLVKYDAFKEIGGKLSFVLVLLTAEDNGFILNCMHSTKEGCYTYVKEVVGGEAFVILSEEEQQALEEAKMNISLENLSELVAGQKKGRK